MYPILARYGPIILYSYTVAIGSGILAGFGVTAWLARKYPLPYWPDAFLATLVSGFIGGRIGFIITQWSYYQERPSETGQIWQGGLNYHGALLAGLLGLWGWCTWQKRPFSLYAGLFAPAYALVSSFGWLACWLEGCGYGREAVVGLLTADLPDNFGIFAVRYQAQLIGLVLSLGFFLLLLRLYHQWPPARTFWFTQSGLSLGQMVVNLFRGDPSFTIQQIRIDTLINGSLALTSLLLLQYSRKHHLGENAKEH